MTIGFGKLEVGDLDKTDFSVVLGIKPDWRCVQEKMRNEGM